MSVERFRDDPWARLPWVLPVALVLTVSSQVGFVALLQQGLSAPAQKPVVVQVMDLPVATPAPVPTPAPRVMPPPPRRERPEPARPEPPVARPPSTPPSPE